MELADTAYGASLQPELNQQRKRNPHAVAERDGPGGGRGMAQGTTLASSRIHGSSWFLYASPLPHSHRPFLGAFVSCKGVEAQRHRPCNVLAAAANGFRFTLACLVFPLSSTARCHARLGRLARPRFLIQITYSSIACSLSFSVSTGICWVLKSVPPSPPS
ncbi:uncharacterized protein LY79DRAFT_218175 [Colletotrichum navitas]|uniref:Uncharacterized protein n=1 Tax=Colletotrichum navitas TaxID=681940 RepID=A0AAD8V338_9PEZI|nr:uncharacterized protein LY79DRAFT_218175 [Colletotrichum navitas]KAK1590430.1 hypothetical protein LY79DRAFT_218175 [Colletotrichum navitas]